MCNHVETYCADYFTKFTNTESLRCTPEPDTMLPVNYISTEKEAMPSGVIPATPRQLPGNQSLWVLRGRMVAKLKLKEPRSHAEVRGKPGERSDLEPPGRQSFQTEGVRKCATCCRIFSHMNREKDLLLTLARVFPWVVKTKI